MKNEFIPVFIFKHEVQNIMNHILNSEVLLLFPQKDNKHYFLIAMAYKLLLHTADSVLCDLDEMFQIVQGVANNINFQKDSLGVEYVTVY